MKFLASSNDFDLANIILLGVPFDATSSFRGGSRFAPDSIRIFSDVLETYSPYFDFDISNIKFFDYGNIWATISNFEVLNSKLSEIIDNFLDTNKKIIAIGGEHLVSLPIVKSYFKKYKNLVYIQLDAHADLRDRYFNEKFSHATVVRRITDFLPNKSIYQFGIRSGLKEEFNFAKNNTKFFPFSLDLDNDTVNELKGKDIYLSIDLDVLDPSIFPGTGTPEPGGITFNDLMLFFKKIYGLNIVGADVVELSPHYDINGVSSIVAAKVIRELLILLNKN